MPIYEWQSLHALQLDKIKLVQTHVPSHLLFLSYQSKPFFKHHSKEFLSMLEKAGRVV